MPSHARSSCVATFALWSLAVAFSNAGCQRGVTLSSSCPPGQLLQAGQCEVLCLQNADCNEDQRCSPTGICVRALRPPRIVQVDGNGIPDPTAGLPDDSRGMFYLGTGLVVTGAHLNDSVWTLRANDGAAIESDAPTDDGEASATPEMTLATLEGSTEARVELLLPQDISEGSYMLQVANADGADAAPVVILQGEPGPAGPAGPGGAVGVCDASACTQPSVRPEEPTVLLTHLLVRAANQVMAQSEQSLKHAGVEVIEQPADGIWLAVFDRTTHDPSALDAHQRNYDVANENDNTDLHLLALHLAQLPENQFAVLVSRGAVAEAIHRDVGGFALIDQLVELGGSAALRQLQPSEAFVLAGYPGMGEGNAVQVISATGVAEAAVVLADDHLLGPRTVSVLGRTIESVEITDGTITTADLSNGLITADKLAPAAVNFAALDPAWVGPGLVMGGEQLQVDPAWLKGQMTSYIRTHCRFYFGWRDQCDGCGWGPEKHGYVHADGASCAVWGGESTCAGGWLGINTDGNVNSDDKFYIRVQCD